MLACQPSRQAAAAADAANQAESLRLVLSGCRPPCEPFVLMIQPSGEASLHLRAPGQPPAMLTRKLEQVDQARIWTLAQKLNPEKLSGLPLMQALDMPLQTLSFMGANTSYELRFKQVQTAELEQLVKTLHGLVYDRQAWKSP